MKRKISSLPASLHLEADHRAVEVRREQPPDRQRRRDAAGSPVKYTRSTRGCAASHGRHPAGVGALPLHAQRERLDAAHRQVAFKRPQHRTDRARPARAASRSARSSVTTTPPSTSPWPARYLVTLCTLKCAPSSSGRDQQRRGERVVHHQRRARLARDLGDPVDLPHAQQRIRDASRSGCSPGLRLRHRRAQRVEIADIHEAHVHARRLQHVHQQADGRAVQRIRRQDRLAPVGQRASGSPCAAPPCPTRRPARRARSPSDVSSSSSAAVDGLS